MFIFELHCWLYCLSSKHFRFFNSLHPTSSLRYNYFLIDFLIHIKLLFKNKVVFNQIMFLRVDSIHSPYRTLSTIYHSLSLSIIPPAYHREDVMMMWMNISFFSIQVNIEHTNVQYR